MSRFGPGAGAHHLHEQRRPVESDELEVSEATVEGLLNGSVWPDLATIARIGRNHQVALWPQRPTAGTD